MNNNQTKSPCCTTKAYFRREKNYIFRELTRNFRELTRNFSYIYMQKGDVSHISVAFFVKKKSR